MLRYESRHPVSHTNGNFFEVNVQYHVFLQGKQLGPYDKRTIVGMRIKNTLSNSDLLIDAHGQQITVGQLLGQRSRPASLDLGASAFDAQQSGAYSPVVGLFTAQRMRLSKGLREMPRFVGPVQVRAHTDLLRLEGSSRKLLKRKAGRVKLPFGQIVRAEQRAANVSLWVRSDTRLGTAPSITLMLHSTDDAKALMEILPEQMDHVQHLGASLAAGAGYAKKWPLDASSRLGQMLLAALGAALVLILALTLWR